MTRDQFIYALTACGCLLKDGKTWYEHNELIECFENLGLLENSHAKNKESMTKEEAKEFIAQSVKSDVDMAKVADAIKALEQEPKFIAKSDGTIEQIKNCNGCVFRKEWEKIGKLLSVVLEKQTEQEPKTGHWIDTDEWRETVDGFEQWGYFRKCSKCGYVFKFLEIDNYCPNCGAKMESEE